LKPSLATLKILVSKCLSQYIFYQSLSNVLVKLWQEYEDFEAVTRKNETEAYDDAIENWQRALKELKKQLEEWHKERQEQLEKLLEDIEYLFLDKQSKAGTIEWPLRKYRTDSLNRKESKILKTAKHQFLEWKNTWKALLADWVLNLEVYDFWYETRYQMNDMRRIWLDKCDNSLKPVLDPLKQYIEEVNVKP
jgi:predicted RNase H-like nuclease (RuvC/YqgF family)